MKNKVAYRLFTAGLPAILVLAGMLFLSAPALAQKPKPKVWKVGTLAPKGIGYANLVETVLVPLVAQATDDRLTFKVFFGGIMGGDDSVIARMDQGQLEGAGLSGQGALLVCRDFSVLTLPYLFSAYDEVDYVKGKMTPAFEQMLLRRGFRLLSWIDQDFDRIYSTDKPMARLSDFAGARMVCWSGFVERALIETLGAEPVVLDVPEIPSAIRTGKANINVGPAIWMVGTQLHGVVRYVVDQPIRYMPALILATESAWSKLPESYQKSIEKIRPEITEGFCEGIRKENERYLLAMVNYGVNRIVMAPENLKQMKEATHSIGHDLAGIQYSRQILDELLAHLRDFRATKGR